MYEDIAEDGSSVSSEINYSYFVAISGLKLGDVAFLEKVQKLLIKSDECVRLDVYAYRSYV